MNTPRKATVVAIPIVTPTMALDKPTSNEAEDDDVEVAEADDVVVEEVVVVDELLVDVAVDVLLLDEEVAELVDVDVAEVEEDVDVDVAEVVELSSVLVVVLSARSKMSRLLRPWNDRRRSSPSGSAGPSSPAVDPVWHFSVIHSAFSASSVVHPAASRQVARSSGSTVWMPRHRDIIGSEAHDRSATIFSRHPLPISRGAAVAGLASSMASATRGRFSRMLNEFIVYVDDLMVSSPGIRTRGGLGLEMLVNSIARML